MNYYVIKHGYDVRVIPYTEYRSEYLDYKICFATVSYTRAMNAVKRY